MTKKSDDDGRDDPRWDAFRSALESQLAARKTASRSDPVPKGEAKPGTQKWLGDRIGVSQSIINNWLQGDRLPSPWRVFDMERALDLQPGSLSRVLGYLPASARSVVTVEDAIRADATLTARHRDALLAMYRALSDPGKEG